MSNCSIDFPVLLEKTCYPKKELPSRGIWEQPQKNVAVALGLRDGKRGERVRENWERGKRGERERREERGDSPLRRVPGRLQCLARPPPTCQDSTEHRIKMIYRKKVEMAIPPSPFRSVTDMERRLKTAVTPGRRRGHAPAEGEGRVGAEAVKK